MNQFDRNGMIEAEKTVLQCLTDLEDTMLSLSLNWELGGMPNNLGSYPFHKSFDELTLDVIHWANHVRNVYKRAEELNNG